MSSLLETSAASGQGDPNAGGGGGTPTVQTPPGNATEFTWTGADGNFSEGWLDRLPDDVKPARDMLSKYRSVQDLAKAAFHKEQLLGKKSGAVVIPTDKSTPEEIAAFRKALGIPEKPEDYALKPEKLPDGVEFRDEHAKALAALAHKHNVTPGFMKELTTQLLETRAADAKAAVDAHNAKVEKESQAAVQALAGAWKGDFQKNIETVRRVARTVGLDDKSPGLSDPEVVKALFRLGGMVSEDRLVKGGDGSGGGLGNGNPGSTAKDIMTNKTNPLYEKYQKGDPDTVNYVRGLLKQSTGE